MWCKVEERQGERANQVWSFIDPTHTHSHPFLAARTQEGCGRGLEGGPAVRPPLLASFLSLGPLSPSPTALLYASRGLRLSHRHTESREDLPSKRRDQRVEG